VLPGRLGAQTLLGVASAASLAVGAVWLLA
jgi:hypothetical protein